MLPEIRSRPQKSALGGQKRDGSLVGTARIHDDKNQDDC